MRNILFFIVLISTVIVACHKDKTNGTTTLAATLDDTTVNFFMPYREGSLLIFKETTTNEVETLSVYSLSKGKNMNNTQHFSCYIKSTHFWFLYYLDANASTKKDFLELTDLNYGTQFYTGNRPPKINNAQILVHISGVEYDTITYLDKFILGGDTLNKVYKIYSSTGGNHYYFSEGKGLVYFDYVLSPRRSYYKLIELKY